MEDKKVVIICGAMARGAGKAAAAMRMFSDACAEAGLYSVEVIAEQELIERIKFIDELKEESYDFKCEPNRKQKGHVKPFYQKGRW